MPTVLSANYWHTHATVKGIHFRTEAADKHKACQGSGVSATFASLDSSGNEQHVTRFGIISRILNIRPPTEATQPTVVFQVKWFNPSLVSEDPESKGIKLIWCTGRDDDFDLDTNPYVLAEKVDEQIFYTQLPKNEAPGQGSQPWLWVMRDTASSHLIPEHLFDDDGQLVDVVFNNA